MAHTPGSPLTNAASDPLRDGPARFLAFTSDVGEAFKMFISRRWYLGSYAVVALYGAVDTADKGRRAYARALATRQQQQQQQAAPTTGATLPAGCSPSPAGTPVGLPASAAAVAAACAACLPAPPSLYQVASTASEQHAGPLAVLVAAAVLDTALWHSAASLAIPAALINRTVWATRALLARPAAAARLHPRVVQLAPPATGLALIPLAVHHIDGAVTSWMDAHLRPHLPAEAQPEKSSGGH